MMFGMNGFRMECQAYPNDYCTINSEAHFHVTSTHLCRPIHFMTANNIIEKLVYIYFQATSYRENV